MNDDLDKISKESNRIRDLFVPGRTRDVREKFSKISYKKMTENDKIVYKDRRNNSNIENRRK